MAIRPFQWFNGLSTALQIFTSVAGVSLVSAIGFVVHWHAEHERQADAGLTSVKTFLDRRDYERAEAAATRLLQQDKADPDVLYLRARAFAAEGKYGEAMDDLQSVEALEPRRARSRVLAGFVNLKLQDFDAARAELDTALDLAPDDLEALFTRAQLAAWQHDYKGARDDLQRLLAVRPQSQKGLFLMAGVYSRLDEVAKAENSCIKLLRLDAGNYRVPELCAVIAHRACDWDSAVRLYDRALVLKPEEEAVIANRDRALARLRPLEDRQPERCATSERSHTAR